MMEGQAKYGATFLDIDPHNKLVDLLSTTGKQWHEQLERVSKSSPMLQYRSKETSIDEKSSTRTNKKQN
jgi:hypothetical protein